ncbi:MAG: hypothetical protein KJ011_07360 [Burkholderiaceae bacterium]|jgi:hypothetical protein|nr:hypothetical protein [Burkholderiaceae bacterium]
MSFAWFVYFHDAGAPGVVDAADRSGIRELCRRVPGLSGGYLYTPAAAVGGPFADDEPPPRLALQLCFAELPSLEAAIAPGGSLAALAADDAWPSLAGTTARHQAMVVRPFPVPDRPPSHVPGSGACSYLVHYPGRAEDMNAWLLHYLTHHPQLMAHLPDIRAIEIYTRLDWCDGLPWERVRFMQRNRIVFDSVEALAASFASPALRAMRADFRHFPPFAGGNVHYPMCTEAFAP